MNRRPAWWTAEDARADRAARYGVTSASTGDRPNYARPAGVLAWHGGLCPKCDREVEGAQIYKRKGEWVCTGCAPGADDDA